MTKSVAALTLLTEHTELDEATKLAKLFWFHRTLEHKISPVLLGALTDETEVAKIGTTAEMSAYLDHMLQQLQKIADTKGRR